MVPIAAAESDSPSTKDAQQAARRIDLGVIGMHCASCVNRVEGRLRVLPGVKSADVNLATKMATVIYAPNIVPMARLAAAIREAGYEPILPVESGALREQVDVADRLDELERRDEADLRRRFMFSAVLSIPVVVIAMSHGSLAWLDGTWAMILQLVLSTAVMVFGAAKFLQSALNSARRGAADMNTLVSLGSGAAYLYSVAVVLRHVVLLPGDSHAHAPHVYFESAATIITLILLGKLLEARATRRTAGAIRRLVELQPRMAQLVDATGERDIAVDEIAVGDRLAARPGQTIAVDGVVVMGETDVDESMLTGEAAPQIKRVGNTVYAGTMNRTGAIHYRAEKIGAATTLQQIVRLVREAQGGRAPISRLADRLSAVFVPLVLGIAVVTFVAWVFLAAPGQRWELAVSTSVAVLVIACPCALGLATPTAIIVATGRAAQRGILIRSGAALEAAGRVTDVLFDKTGTLTTGRPVVTEIHTGIEMTPNDALSLAACAERHSEHPIAHAILAAENSRGLAPVLAREFKSFVGGGVRAVVDGRTVVVGSAEFLVTQGMDPVSIDRATRLSKASKINASSTLVFVGLDQSAVAAISLSDELRATAQAAVEALRKQAVDVWLVSGDRREAVESVAKRVGIGHVLAGFNPAQKSSHVRELQSDGRVVAMVGDGINDAPALATADVGMAMSGGTDIAITAADMTILRGDPSAVADAISLSRATLATIRQNLCWAFGYNLLSIPLAAGVLYPSTGWLLSPMVASATMAISSISVVLNSLRLRRS